MKAKSYFFITVLLCIFTLLFATAFVFAGNIGRAVYGVLTETYNGTSIDNPSAGADYVHMYGSGYDNADRVEGAVSTSVGWEGWFGIYFDTAQDMSAYTGGRIYFSAKVPTTVNINDTNNVFKVSDGVDEIKYFNSADIKRIDSNLTGINNDNSWHTYYIELSSFGNNLDLTNITYLFIADPISTDNTLLIDNVYWTKAPNATRAFNVTVKNRSDNQATADEKITWTQAAYRQSWTAAQQYIELDLDRESYNESYNWHVRIYLNNGKASRTGLYCVDDGEDIVLPMAWRIRPDLLPNGTDTLEIARYTSGACGLYDVGREPNGTDWYTWCPMREANGGLNFDDIKVWDLRGIHTVVWTHDSWDTLKNYYERKPKIYFAADCSNAIGGLEYEANVVTELVYE